MNGSEGSAESFRNLMKSISSQIKLSQDTESKKWFVRINNVASKDIKHKKDDMVNYSRTQSYDLLWIQTEDGLFDFSEAPLERLDDFIGNPEHICFPPISTLRDGFMKSVENSLQLVNSVDVLFSSDRTHSYLGLMSFLLLSSIEEIGKAHMIAMAAKEAAKKKWKTAMIRGLKKHPMKFNIAGKQLKPFAEQLDLLNQATLLHELCAKIEGEPDGVFGKRHREYGLYVGYSPTGKRWRTFQSQYEQTLVSPFSENEITSWICLLKTACNTLLQEARSKPLHEVTELKDVMVWLR